MPGWLGFTFGAAFIIVALVGESASLRRARELSPGRTRRRVAWASQQLDRMGGLSQ